MKKGWLLALLPMSVWAAPIKGFYQTYQDWDLVCDNTGSCTMAGYQSDENFERPVSIVFTRPTGENAPVSAMLSFSPYDYQTDKEIPTDKFAEIFVNGQSLGKLSPDAEKNYALNEAQTATLLDVLKKSSQIEVVSGQFKGVLSDKGAAAAMLRMDEFQQRLGTPSALIRKGNSTKAVLVPQPTPQIQAVAVPNPHAYTLKKGTKRFNAVMALLRKANGSDELSDNYCNELHRDDWEGDINIYPLTQGKVLAEAICLMGAYQGTNYYVVMDEKLTRVEQQLANQYNNADYGENDGVLTVIGLYKARGIGDCYQGQDAVWNGKIFIRSSEWTTGSCKGVPLGLWNFPIFVSSVVVK